jgi:hypothetical protein
MIQLYVALDNDDTMTATLPVDKVPGHDLMGGGNGKFKPRIKGTYREIPCRWTARQRLVGFVS